MRRQHIPLRRVPASGMWWNRLFSALLFVTLLSTAVADSSVPTSLATLRGESMGTRWQLTLPATQATPATRQLVENELARLTAALSAWEPDSELSQFNRSAGEWQTISSDFLRVIEAALQLAEDSGGAYDPTVAPLVALWGFGPDGQRRNAPPAAEEISAARARVGWQKIRLDHSASRLQQPGDMQLDINAIGPGYAVDRVIERLHDAGLDGLLFELGGELRASGRKPDGNVWRIAVERPDQADLDDPDFDLIVALDDAALGSSGDYRSGFVHAGRRYAHTIDPRRGEPVQHRLAAVSVLAETAMLADGLAATLMVLGPEAGWQWAEQRGIAAAFTIRDEDGSYRRRLTPRFATRRTP